MRGVLAEHRQHGTGQRGLVDHDLLPHSARQWYLLVQVTAGAGEDGDRPRGPALAVQRVLDALDVRARRHPVPVIEVAVVGQGADLVQEAVHPGTHLPPARAGVDAAVEGHHRQAVGLEPHDAVDRLCGDHRSGPPRGSPWSIGRITADPGAGDPHRAESQPVHPEVAARTDLASGCRPHRVHGRSFLCCPVFTAVGPGTSVILVVLRSRHMEAEMTTPWQAPVAQCRRGGRAFTLRAPPRRGGCRDGPAARRAPSHGDRAGAGGTGGCDGDDVRCNGPRTRPGPTARCRRPKMSARSVTSVRAVSRNLSA